ncbi:hypothetical protein W03_10740 [Nitrosomonas sp. PY1]|uniref:hypothetical protein n=1 Tax=Nitrosomonas sp. PY1 TaxID=1803906 RepID=UPI001FC89B7E|nr:hypothetical protein [Nitrosomonas sp. PY1]GKS69070.1 hypothetical protein W03_10740 [Nitrosomonas sp. PY1]
MRKYHLKQSTGIALLALSIGYTSISKAHEASAVMGEQADFLGYATVTCGGSSTHFEAAVKDLSGPVAGLQVNLQIIKGSIADSTTDPVSGDLDFSPYARVDGGAGTYQLLVNKTAVGARAFEVSYHCKLDNGLPGGEHTETDIVVRQFWSLNN